MRPLTNPRHAFVMSKLVAEVGSPMRWWIRTATEGSSVARVTEVFTSSPTRSRGTPACSRAATPARAAASWKSSVSSQFRRLRTPATRSRREPGRRRRVSTSASWSSRSCEVTSTGASTSVTARRAAREYS